MSSVPAVHSFSTLPGATPPAPPPKPGNSDSGTKDSSASPANEAAKSTGVNVLA